MDINDGFAVAVDEPSFVLLTWVSLFSAVVICLSIEIFDYVNLLPIGFVAAFALGTDSFFP